jgi:hypothetical protein
MLWSVGDQAVEDDAIHTDTLALSRRFTTGVSAAAHYTHFASAHFGVTVEATYLGLATSDGCSVLHDSGDANIATACSEFHGTTVSSGGAFTLTGGVVWRIAMGGTLQPYLKAAAGIFTLNANPVEVTVGHQTAGNNVYAVYTDRGWSSVRPTGVLAGGISTAANSGFQVHLEARESFVGLPTIIGTNPLQGDPARIRSTTKGFLSILAGVDLVLKRNRGRRY